jgi:hypothetical protein
MRADSLHYSHMWIIKRTLRGIVCHRNICKVQRFSLSTTIGTCRLPWALGRRTKSQSRLGCIYASWIRMKYSVR